MVFWFLIIWANVFTLASAITGENKWLIGSAALIAMACFSRVVL